MLYLTSWLGKGLSQLDAHGVEAFQDPLLPLGLHRKNVRFLCHIIPVAPESASNLCVTRDATLPGPLPHMPVALESASNLCVTSDAILPGPFPYYASGS